jgi:hypothetical protein
MSGSGPWWLTVTVAFVGPLAGIAVSHRLTSGRDRAQERRADRERDRAERRRGYLGLFEAADALEVAIADGRGEQALADLRRAKTIAMFESGPGIESYARELVAAGQRLVRVAAADTLSSRATLEAAGAFRERLAAAHAAMRADISTDQGWSPGPGPSARSRSLMSRLRGSSSSR